MKRLIIPPGGMPFEGDDLKYIQDSFFQGFKFLLQAISPDPDEISFILQGVELNNDGTTITLTPGIVVINYEMLEFPGASFPASDIDSKAIVIDESYDPAGNEIFADNVSKDTYFIRKAKLGTSTGVREEITLTDSHQFVYLGEKIMKLPHLSGRYQLNTEDYVSGELIAYKQANIVILQGKLSSSTGSFNGEIIPTLPDHLRPAHQILSLIPIDGFDNNTFEKHGIIQITKSGYVGLWHPHQNVVISNIVYSTH